MAVFLVPKPVHCNNCNAEGKSLVRGAGWLMRLSSLALIIGGIYFWPLFLVVAGLMVYQLFQPARHFCRECGSADITPLDQYRKFSGAGVNPPAAGPESSKPITPEHSDSTGGNKPIEP